MKCLQLLDTYVWAGTERHVFTLAEALPQYGVQTILGCRSDTVVERRALDSGLQVIGLGQRPGPSMFIKLVKTIREEQIDVIHAHNGTTMLMAACAATCTGVRAVGTQHFLSPRFMDRGRWKRAASMRAHHWVNDRLLHIITVSKAARDEMLARESPDPSRLSIIVNGIRPPTLPSPAAISELRSQMNVSEGGPLIVAASRLKPEKGLEYLLDCVPSVLAKVPAARFAVVGGGELRASLEQRFSGKPWAQAIRFIGFRENATDYIAAADIFVVPSLAEPFGLTLIEAMALRRPVIATKAGGPSEIVVDGETGVLVPPADSQALADAIISLCGDPEARRSMAEKGYTRFEERFEAARMAAATADIYRKVLTQSKRAEGAALTTA